MFEIDLESFDLTQLPITEDDYFEFKSSLIVDNDNKLKELNKKLSCAISGFANSGGGCFIAGVDNSGNADHGIPLKVGNQDLRDWVDNVIHQVEPCPRYDIKLLQDPSGKGIIKTDSAVLMVLIYESYFGPHMAPDKHYYIRAGAHTVKAKHFIVDAIWSKRHFSKPQLTHLFRLKPGKENVVQLGILAITENPALNVKIKILPLPETMQGRESQFPLKISMIDRRNPFFFDIKLYAGKDFEQDVHLEVEYNDISENYYKYKEPIKVIGSLPPITIGNDDFGNAVGALKEIVKALSAADKPRERIVKSSFVLPRISHEILEYIQKSIPELLKEMKDNLHEYPFVREFIIINERCTYIHDPNNSVFSYFFEKHTYLRNKLRILENYGLIYEITYNDVARFVFSEELVSYLISNAQAD
jgi:Putative DNA-binding domain